VRLFGPCHQPTLVSLDDWRFASLFMLDLHPGLPLGDDRLGRFACRSRHVRAIDRYRGSGYFAGVDGLARLEDLIHDPHRFDW